MLYPNRSVIKPTSQQLFLPLFKREQVLLALLAIENRRFSRLKIFDLSGT